MNATHNMQHTQAFEAFFLHLLLKAPVAETWKLRTLQATPVPTEPKGNTWTLDLQRTILMVAIQNHNLYQGICSALPSSY